MRNVLISSLLMMLAGVGSSVFAAYTVGGVKVTGEDRADLFFEVKGTSDTLPQLAVQGNVVEVTFPGADLQDGDKERLDSQNPHALVQRIGFLNPQKGVTKARVTVNGSLDGLKSRLALVREAGGFRLAIDYPKGSEAQLSLLKEEQLPVGVKKESKAIEAGTGLVTWVLVLLFISFSGAATYFFVRFLKKKTPLGSRKYLIEQLSYHSFGNKEGVSLLKVGNEFILVGVTPAQVSFLSTLPKLQEQYTQESALERNDFKVVVQEELGRIRQPRMTS